VEQPLVVLYSSSIEICGLLETLLGVDKQPAHDDPIN